MPRTARLPLLLSIPLLACRAAPPVAEPGSPADALARIVAGEWEERLREDPSLAAREGRDELAGGLRHVAAEDQARRAARALHWLGELERVDVDALDDRDRVSHAMLARELRERVQADRFRAWQIPWNSDSGFHTALASLPRTAALATAEDQRAYLARLREVPRVIDEQIANLRRGVAEGRTLPRAILDGFEDSIGAHVVDEADASVFFAPFQEDRFGLAEDARAIVLEDVVPAYRRLYAFFVDEYRPGARTSLAAAALPDGRAYYASRVRWFTTLDTTPEEVHEVGLREVARIRGEMQRVVDAVGFEGDLAAFLAFLRTDERFYAKTPDELLAAAAWIAKRADAELPRFFGRLPRQPYGVEPVPPEIAPRYTGGRYVPAPPSGTEAGTYWVNTYALESRPLYVLPALTLHEAVPGHHLQIALTAEQEDLPAFRRDAYIDAFGEGWALYCEWLGVEMGIYRDPYEEFGRLTYEMWRACRLVIDTGLHAFDWTREQAIEYLAANTALSLHECRTEVDRYIGWPGQALAYKTGELEIRALRRRAEAAAGEGFDVRAFHDLVLAEGTVPLDVLGARVEAAYGLE